MHKNTLQHFQWEGASAPSCPSLRAFMQREKENDYQRNMGARKICSTGTGKLRVWGGGPPRGVQGWIPVGVWGL